MTTINVKIPEEQGASQSEVQEIAALLRRTNTDQPQPADVAALQRYFDQDALVWRHIGDAARQATTATINAWYGTALQREAVERMVQEIKRELGQDGAPMLERLLIDQVALCWLRLYQLETTYTDRLLASGSHSQDSGRYWEQRLTSAQRRYMRACESLAKVRKLSRNTPALQVNIATHGGQQVNVAGDVRQRGPETR